MFNFSFLNKRPVSHLVSVLRVCQVRISRYPSSPALFVLDHFVKDGDNTYLVVRLENIANIGNVLTKTHVGPSKAKCNKRTDYSDTYDMLYITSLAPQITASISDRKVN